MKKLFFLLSLLLLTISTVKSRVVNVYVSEGQFFKHDTNLTLVESDKQGKLVYTKHATVLGTAVYEFDLSTHMLTVYVQDSTGLKEFQSSFKITTVSGNAIGDLFFTIQDGVYTGTFRITKSVLGANVLTYESKEKDAVYGFFDPVVYVEKKESN